MIFISPRAGIIHFSILVAIQFLHEYETKCAVILLRFAIPDYLMKI